MLDIDLSRDAAKTLDRLPPKHARQIAAKIMALRENPAPPDSLSLKGAAGAYRRADSGEYRIIYRVAQTTLIVAVIGKRNDDEVYRRLERKLR
ncbi:MAG: type II toxin-antitoxin system RelE/ParE family toxin [Rhodospirillaceae bacterium]|nr:type II toxin-antitoxin system RelE/ParE family toxin [Rhodospirillaceae bacterium]